MLLERAYANPGKWAGTRLADPSPEHVSYFASGWGISVTGPDNAPTLSGRRNNAYTRWGRGFVRAVYYQHKWWSMTGTHGAWRGVKRTTPRSAGALELEWGRRMPAVGVIPAGRAVRVRLRPGGRQSRAAVGRMSEAERIYDDDGRAAGRHADVAGRDW